MSDTPGDRDDARRRVSLWTLLLVGVLPTALIAFGNMRFIQNHFYSRPGYLLDSGWYSAIVYRSGILQDNPQIACNYADRYYGIHVSPLTSLFSILSYIAPVDRIDWYAFFQGFVFAPLGCAVYLVASRFDWSSSVVSPTKDKVRLPIATLCAIAFAFSAQTIMCVGYPHYEAATSGWVCVLLASLVTGRKKLTWIALALALSVREDAGIHTGCALLAFGYVNERGPKRFIPRRTLAILIGAAFGASVLAIGVQKLGFHSANLLRKEYLGTPTYGHLSGSILGARFRYLSHDCPFIAVPALASVAISIVRRDARYMLGWLAMLPWFLLNLLAHQEAKSHFEAYTGFPFIISAFWTYLYGALIAPADRRLSAPVLEAFFGIACIASIVATYAWAPWFVKYTLGDMAFVAPGNRVSARAFRNAIIVSKQTSSNKHLIVDYAVAALALDALKPGDLFYPGMVPVASSSSSSPSSRSSIDEKEMPDAFAFHSDSMMAGSMLPDLSALQLTRCAHVIDTPFSLCRRDGRATEILAGIQTEEVPPFLALALTDEQSGRRMAPPGGIVTKDEPLGLDYVGHFHGLEGDYEIVWRFDVRDVEKGARDSAIAEVVIDGVGRDVKLAADRRGEQELTIGLTAKRGQLVIARLWHWSRCQFKIVGAELRRVEAPAVPAAVPAAVPTSSGSDSLPTPDPTAQ